MLNLCKTPIAKILPILGIFSLSFGFFQHIHADEVHYNVAIDDNYIGILAVNHEFSGIDYKISAQFEAQSFFNAVYDFKIAGVAQGIGVQYGKYSPSSSAIGIRKNGKKSVIRLSLNEGVITKRQSEPEIFTELPLALDRFAFDPVTALGYLARPQSFQQSCALDILIHAGYYTGRLVLGKPQLRDDGRYECKGVLRRLEGFDLADDVNSDIYLSLILRQRSQTTLELDRLQAETELGRVDIWREFRENYYEDTGEIIVVEDVLAPTQ